MRFLVMFVTAVCVLFLIKLRWPKKKNFYETVFTFPFRVSGSPLWIVHSEYSSIDSKQYSTG